MNLKLGIDVGRVLITPDMPGGADTSFIGGSMEDALRTPPMAGMFNHVPPLVARFATAWLVSKAGPRVQEKTLRWMAHHRFHELTGLPRNQVAFCRERAQKAGICQRLGITHFIDDRTDVLHHLRGIVPNLYLFGPQRSGTRVPLGVTHVLDWAQARAAVERDLDCHLFQNGRGLRFRGPAIDATQQPAKWLI